VYKLFDDLFVLMAYGASKEVNNKKIKTISNSKRNKISYNESEQYASKFMKNINFQTTDTAEKFAIVNKIVGNIVGLVLDSTNKKGFLMSDRPFADRTQLLEEFVINMDGAKLIPEATEKAVMAVGEKLNIFKDKNDANKYKFPLMLKAGSTTYLLQGVDEEITNNSFGKSVINAIAGVGEYRTTGRKARYVALPMELTTNTLSPIGFSTVQSKRYQKLVTKKERINMSEVDMSFGLTAEMFEDYSIKPEIAQPITQLDLDIQNINVTFDVVKHFYEQSGKRQSFEAYAKTFADMAAQLKTTGMTNQEIIEKLKCL
jgi:hypothetical protein